MYYGNQVQRKQERNSLAMIGVRGLATEAPLVAHDAVATQMRRGDVICLAAAYVAGRIIPVDGGFTTGATRAIP
jgi:hypothetical protein